MKCLIIAAFCTFFSTQILAQKFPDLDASPVDIALVKGKDKQPLAKVIYSRPQKKGRVVFGELEPYGKVWRTGANEATEIKIYKDIMVAGKPLKAGTYSLFTIPEKDKWTVIFNSDLDQWGAYSYNKEKDVLRVEIKTVKIESTVEAFSILFKDTDKGANMLMAWDEVMIEIPIEALATVKKK